MIDLSNPDKILEEVEADEKVRNTHLAVVPELVKMYTGPYYKGDEAGSDDAPENHPFEWLSWITPKIVQDNPRAAINARASGVPRDVPMRLEHGINQWSATTGLWRQLQQVFVDMAFCFGVMRVGISPIPGYRGVERRHWGAAKRTDPWRFVIDTRGVSSQSEARYMGHTWRRDKDDLLRSRMPGLNKGAITALGVDRDLDKVEPKEFTGGNVAGGGGRPDRKEVVGWELWVPEYELPAAKVAAWRKRTTEIAEANDVQLPGGFEDDEQLNGTILTMGVGAQGDRRGKAQWIREPRPFWGPPCGPYELFGVYLVPGHVYPLSPLLATYAELLEINAHASAMAVGAANWRRFIVVDATNPAAVKAAEEAKHGSVAAIKDADKAIKSIETGGVDAKQYEYYAFLRQRLERRTGQNDGSRGEVKGDPTATEYADVAAQRESRTAMVRNLFCEHSRGVLHRGGWILYHSASARFALPSSAGADLRPRPQLLPSETQAEAIAAEMFHGIRPYYVMGWEELPLTELIEAVRQMLTWAPKLEYPTDDPSLAHLSLAEITGIPYEQLELSIDPLSMGRVDQAMQMRLAQDQVKMVSETCGLMKDNPQIAWEELYDNYGDAHNVRQFSKVLKMDVLNRIWRTQELAAQMAQLESLGGPAGAGGVGGAGGMAGAAAPVTDVDAMDVSNGQDADMMSAVLARGGGLPGNFSGAMAAPAR